MVRLICSLLHQRFDLVPDTTTPHNLASIAEVADKYNCTIALKHAAAFYINAFSDAQLVDSPISAVKAAYIFNDASIFAKATDLAMKHCYTSHFANFDSMPALEGLQRASNPRIALVWPANPIFVRHHERNRASLHGLDPTNDWANRFSNLTKV